MKELSFADVSRHFHLPLTQAADRLNVSVTLVKRICRENGVSRWPFRKLQSRMKKERIVARDVPPAGGPETAGHPLALAPAPGPGAPVELPGVGSHQSELLEHYLASLVDFVDSTDTEPLDMASHDPVFGAMVDQTLEGAYLRGWNSFASDVERFGGMFALQPGALALPPAPGGASSPLAVGGDGGGPSGIGRGGSGGGSGGDGGGGSGIADPGRSGAVRSGAGGDGSSDGSHGERGKLRRVRKGKEFSFADVSRHFHLPLTQAAELLNVSVTLVKRVCRENGVSRWPFRKLQARMRKEPIQRQPQSIYEPSHHDSDAEARRAAAAAVSAAFWPAHAYEHVVDRGSTSMADMLAGRGAESSLGHSGAAPPTQSPTGGAPLEGLQPPLHSPEAAQQTSSLLKQPASWPPALAAHSLGAFHSNSQNASSSTYAAAGQWRSMGSGGFAAGHSIPPQQQQQPWAVPQPQ